MKATVFATAALGLAGAIFGFPQIQSNLHSFVIETFHNPVTVTPIYHASLLLEEGNKSIYVDPATPGDFSGLPHADMILITDGRKDHLDAREVESISTPGTAIIAPPAVVKMLGRGHALRTGERTTLLGWFIVALATHKGEGNGYVLTYGSKSFYISGETEATPDMRGLKGIDVAFVSIRLPDGMSPGEAAEVVKAFHPKMAIPYAYCGSDPRVFAKDLEGTGIAVKLVDWYPGDPQSTKRKPPAMSKP